MLERDKQIPTIQLVDAMTLECPYCKDTITRYDLRLHHFIWDCCAYPDWKRRIYFQKQSVDNRNHS